jgi:hypothetical protein
MLKGSKMLRVNLLLCVAKISVSGYKWEIVTVGQLIFHYRVNILDS